MILYAIENVERLKNSIQHYILFSKPASADNITDNYYKCTVNITAYYTTNSAENIYNPAVNFTAYYSTKCYNTVSSYTTDCYKPCCATSQPTLENLLKNASAEYCTTYYYKIC